MCIPAFAKWAVRALGPWLLAAMAACGGGGGGAGSAPETLTGDFFPLAVGDRWVYTGDDGSRATVRATETRSVDGQTGVLVAAVDRDGMASESVYVVSPGGVRQLPVLNDDPLALAIGAVQVMRFPLVVGESFVQIDKSIATGTDFDGDGRIENAQVRSEVQVVGRETASTPAGSFPGSLHLRTTLRVSVRLSGLGQTVIVDSTVDDWYAPDIGPVHSIMRTRADGMDETETLTLSGYRVGTRRSESTPPAVKTAWPASGSVQGITAAVTVVFSELIDPATGTDALILTDAGGMAVAGTVQPGLDSLGFWPTVPLASGRYTVRLAPTLADWLGNELGTSPTWYFDIDASGPQVVAVTPAPGATAVALGAAITVRYDETLDPSSMNAGNVALRSLMHGEAAVSVTVAGDTVTVVPLEPLVRGVEYELVLGTFGNGVRDVHGNFASSGVVTQFSTDPGRFGQPQLLLDQFLADAVAAGDVNGDGRNDVVAAVGYSANADWAFRLAVFAQQADGRLAAAPTWLATRADYACRPTSVAVGDVDGDGRQDVVVAQTGCGIEVFKQGTDGVLHSSGLLPSPQSYMLRLADFNGDGRLDLLAAGWSDSVVRLWLQSSTGTLVDAGTPAANHAGWGHLAVGDLDGDGRTDFVVTSGQGAYGQSVAVVLQQAGGGFAPAVYLGSAPGVMPGGVAVGDVDGDGRAELLVSFDGHVGVWRYGGGGMVRAADLATAGGAGPIALADINGDGRRDMLVAHTGGAGLGVFLQQAAGLLSAEATYPGYAPWGVPDALAVSDISGDGRPDAVLVNAVVVQRQVETFAQGVRPKDAKALLQRLPGGPWR